MIRKQGSDNIIMRGSLWQLDDDEGDGIYSCRIKAFGPVMYHQESPYDHRLQ